MSTPIKILEVGGEAWMSGISLQPYLNIGGLFREATNFDPFEQIGIYKTSLVGREWGASTVAVAGLFNVEANISNTPYFYNFGNDTVYRVKVTGSVSNVQNMSAHITGMTNMRGAGAYKNKILYASNDTLKARPTDISTGSEVTLLSNLETANHIMKDGADQYFYMTNKNHLAKITNVDGTTGNDAQYYTFEDDIVLRDLESDGKYLVIAGDNNGSTDLTFRMVSKCFVAFWNMKSQDFSQYWEFKDSNVIAIQKIENDILVFGRNNIYICNVDSPPQVLMSLMGNSNIVQPVSGNNTGAVTSAGDGVVMWGGTDTVYAYGRVHPSLKRIFYKPYSLTTNNVSSLFHTGSFLFATTDGTFQILDFAQGSTRQTSTVSIAGIDFKTKYKLSFVKVILNEALESGESVDVLIKTENDTRTILSSNEWQYASDGTNSSHMFYPKQSSSSSSVIAGLFEDVTKIQIINKKAAIRRVEVWAEPVGPRQNSGY